MYIYGTYVGLVPGKHGLPASRRDTQATSRKSPTASPLNAEMIVKMYRLCLFTIQVFAEISISIKHCFLVA